MRPAPARDDAGDPLARGGRARRATFSSSASRKDVVRLEAEVERLERKLGNDQFATKAAPDVVAKERAKLAAYRDERARASAQVVALAGNGAP